MLQLPGSFRSSPRTIVADYLAGGLKIILLAATVVFTRVIDGSALSQFLSWASLAYLVVTVAEPFVRQVLNIYTITADELVHENHFVFHRVRSIPWETVTAVEVERPWAHRLMGLSRVIVTQASTDEGSVVLHGVFEPVVQSIQQLAAIRDSHAHAPAPGNSSAEHCAVVHRVSLQELIVMSFTHGQALALGFGAILMSVDLADDLGISDVLGAMVTHASLPLTVAVGLAITLMLGIVSTLLRYHDFHVMRLDNGQLQTRFGLLSTRQRHVDADKVLGLVVHQNILELALGRARLGVLTRDAKSRMSTNIVLPSATVEQVSAIADTYFEQLWISARTATPMLRPAVGRLLVTTVPPTLLGVTVLAQGLPLWAGIAATLILWLILRALAFGLGTKFLCEPISDVVTIQTDFTHRRRTTLRLSAVHGYGHTAWRTRPTRPYWAWMSTYAGGPRRYISLFPEFTDLQMLADAHMRFIPKLEGTCR